MKRYDTHALDKEVRLFFQKEKYISVKDGKVKEAIKAILVIVVVLAM